MTEETQPEKLTEAGIVAPDISPEQWEAYTKFAQERGLGRLHSQGDSFKEDDFLAGICCVYFAFGGTRFLPNAFVFGMMLPESVLDPDREKNTLYSEHNLRIAEQAALNQAYSDERATYDDPIEGELDTKWMDAFRAGVEAFQEALRNPD